MKVEKNRKKDLKKTLAPVPVKMSICIMGTGQLYHRQWGTGLIYIFVFMLFMLYMLFSGAKDMVGFFTLGTREASPWLGTTGDDSIMMMLRGLLAFTALAAYIIIYISNVKDAIVVEARLRQHKPLPSFMASCKTLVDKKFYVVSLALPMAGILIFNVIPILFMICIAFTNYGGEIVPPKLVDWVGLENFKTIFTLADMKGTFIKILSWNIVWAVLATFFNYFGGLGLALLLNKKCVKGKRFWRAFPILAYAVPGFITLLAFKFMFSYGGPVNYYITKTGANAVGFLDMDAGIKAKAIGLAVNAWISIPTSMLLATGILSNMNAELYEAARVDGASRWKQFVKITLPFVLFSTTPVLISSFIGNFNNFGVFYFLRGGLYCDGYFLASDTDLLINWLYNLSIDNNYYGIGAAISLIIFLITSIFSLAVYVRSAAYKKEDTFQ